MKFPRLRKALKTAETAKDRRPAWLKATDDLGITYVVEHEFKGRNRAERRRARATAAEMVERQQFYGIGRPTYDAAAVRRKAYQAGCHGKSVAPLLIEELEARYTRHTNRRPLTPAQARRIRKARRAEVSA